MEKLLSFFSPETVDVARFLKNILIVVSKVIILQVRDKASHTVNTAVMNVSESFFANIIFVFKGITYKSTHFLEG